MDISIVEDFQSPSGANFVIGDSLSHLSIFRETTASYNSCLLLNLQYQTELNRIICGLHLILEQNLENQRRITTENDQKRRKRTVVKNDRKPTSLFCAPYFVDTRGRITPENEDALLKRKRGDLDAYTIPPKFWVKSEKNRLIDAVFRIIRQQELMPYLNRKSYLQSKQKREKLQDVEEEKIRCLIDEINNSIVEIKKKSNDKLLEDLTKEIDWLQVSTICMGGTRSPEECERKWNTLLHPWINSKKFSLKEDRSLKKWARQFSERNWEAIAESLGTNRNGIQCLQRYEGLRNSRPSRKFWTPEDDLQLKEIVLASKVGDSIVWHQVTYHMPGWTRLQIMNRWTRSIRPETHWRAWSLEEDAVLCGAFQKYPMLWQKVSDFIPGRTNYQCRDRYLSHFTPNLVAGDWTVEDDRKLIKFVADCGEKWSQIGKFVDDRSISSCIVRYLYMKKQNSLAVKKAIIKIQSGVSAEVAMKKQFAKTRSCGSFNQQNQILRDNALNKLKEIVMEMSPNPPTDPDIGEWKIPIRILRKVSEKLLSNVPPLDLPLRQPSYRILEQNSFKTLDDGESDFSSSDSDDLEGIEISESEGDDEFTLDEKQDIDEELEALFVTRAASATCKMKKSFTSTFATRVHECNALIAILAKSFQMKNKPLNPCTYRGLDYAESVQNVVDMFVFPPPVGNEMPVLPPTLATVNGMLGLIVSKKLLETLAQKDVSSELMANYKSIVIDAATTDRRCYACRTDTKGQDQECECHVIQQLRERFLLLRKRFVSIFLWPALMSDTPLTQEQMKLLILNDVPEIQTPRLYQNASRPAKKRKYKDKKKLEIHIL